MSAPAGSVPDLVPGPFLRATVLSPDKAVDVVLPTDQPVAALVPGLLDLLDYPAGGHGHHLVGMDGTAVRDAARLGELGMRDGVVLRLITAEESPPDPVVYDLVDGVEQTLPAGVWDERTREWGLALVAASLLATAAVLAGSLAWPGPAAAGAALGGVGLLWSLGAAVARRPAVAWVAFGMAWAALAVAAALAVPDGRDGRDGWYLLAGVPVLLLSVGWCAGRVRASLAGIGCWLVLAGAGLLAWAGTQDLTLSAAVVAVVAGALLGLTPRLALASTGAFRVDGALLRGAELRANTVADTVAAAHLSLAAGVVVLAATGGVALYVVAVTGGTDPWLVGLVVSATCAWLVRVRHFPLTVERLALWAAGLCGAGGLLRTVLEQAPAAAGWVVAATAAVAVMVLAVLVRPPSPLRAANGRRWAGRLETLALLVTLPLLVGAFGVYADLLDTF